MNKYYSFEAHLLHSGLQMVWKRLNVTKEMDARQIWNHNKDIFASVSDGLRHRFGVFCRDNHMKEASEMLHYAFQLNMPKSFYVIVHQTATGNKYGVTLGAAGDIVCSDTETEWTQAEAHAVLMEIKERHPKESCWLETRVPRYVRRTMYGDF